MAIKKAAPVQKKLKKDDISYLYDDVDLSDIPEDCLSELKYGKGKKNMKPITKNILELFKLNPGDISLNMLVVAYYRKFGEKAPRKKIQESVAHLKNYHLIQGLGNTFFRYVGD